MYSVDGGAHSLRGLPGAASDLVRALDGARRALAREASLSGTELRAMFRVAESGETTPTALAESLDVSGPTVTAILTRLVARELVSRTRHPVDRRRLVIELSAEGHELMANAYRSFEEVVERAALSIGVEWRAGLENNLRALADGMTVAR